MRVRAHVPACKYVACNVCNPAGNSGEMGESDREEFSLSPPLPLSHSRTAARNTHQTATRISQKPSDAAAAAAVAVAAAAAAEEPGPPVNTQT